MKIRKKDLLAISFWLLVTIVFLYERRYLIYKAGLGHFLECVAVRVGLILALVYWHLNILLPRFFEAKKYLAYGVSLLLSLAVYIALQSWYDIYLYGFVIGLEGKYKFWQDVPYNFVVTAWYLLLTVALQRSINWYEQSEALATLYRENQILKEQAAVQPSSEKESQSTIFLKTGPRKVKVALSDITHIQGLKDYSIIYTSEEKIVVRGNLKQMEQFFPERKFMRVHKSYLVALDKVQAIDKNKVLIDHMALPIGRNYKEQLAQYLLDQNP